MGERARLNTLLAVAFDLKVFFTVVAKMPEDVAVRDVLGFIESQRRPVRGANVVRLERNAPWRSGASAGVLQDPGSSNWSARIRA